MATAFKARARRKEVWGEFRRSLVWTDGIFGGNSSNNKNARHCLAFCFITQYRFSLSRFLLLQLHHFLPPLLFLTQLQRKIQKMSLVLIHLLSLLLFLYQHSVV